MKTAHLNPLQNKNQLNFITQLALLSFTGKPSINHFNFSN